nr:MAG TPA: Prevent host death protein Host Death, PHD, intrinsic [Caudoviricetes sp.]
MDFISLRDNNIFSKPKILVMYINSFISLEIIITLCSNMNVFVCKGGCSMATDKNRKLPMEHYNMSELLRGQASKIITTISTKDTAGFVLKNGKPLAVIISNDRYERLLRSGIDISEI